MTCGEGGEGGGEGGRRGVRDICRSAVVLLSDVLDQLSANYRLYLGCLSAAASSRVLRKAGCFITAGEETACT